MKLGRNAKVEMLARVPLFGGCSKTELGRIAAIADELAQPDGTVLIREGERGREFFVLAAGEVEVRRGGRRLRRLGGGDFFGEIALLGDSPRTATVTASGPVRLLVVDGRSFQRLLREVPSIQGKVLSALAERLAPTAV